MSIPKCIPKGKREGRSRFRSLFKTKGTRVVSLVIFIISALCFTHQATKVIAAMSVWADLKAAGSNPNAVEEALRRLNNEEITLITPFGLTLLSFAAAFHSVKLKIIPRKCFYCRKWAQAKNVKQTPDRAFYYHVECEVRQEACVLGKQPIYEVVTEASNPVEILSRKEFLYICSRRYVDFHNMTSLAA